jgi:hypothetical protein
MGVLRGSRNEGYRLYSSLHLQECGGFIGLMSEQQTYKVVFVALDSQQCFMQLIGLKQDQP